MNDFVLVWCEICGLKKPFARQDALIISHEHKFRNNHEAGI